MPFRELIDHRVRKIMEVKSHITDVADAMIPWLMCFEPIKYAQAENGGEFEGTLLILL